MTRQGADGFSGFQWLGSPKGIGPMYLIVACWWPLEVSNNYSITPWCCKGWSVTVEDLLGWGDLEMPRVAGLSILGKQSVIYIMLSSKIFMDINGISINSERDSYPSASFENFHLALGERTCLMQP